MKALRSFAVRAALPPALESLLPIATNLRWSWDPQAIDLFRWVDSDAWERAGHDPVKMLGLVSKERFEELAADGPFVGFLASVGDDLLSYMEDPRWFQSRKERQGPATIAYFSPEFGVSEALPIYSGGLGVLSGDHLKAASDAGVPLVAIGLLYRHGYFRQELNPDGWQQERYPALDPHAMPLTLMSDAEGVPLHVEVDLAGARCVAQLWRAHVGRVTLLLLDSDVEANEDDERGVTDRLYGGGSEHRLRQEIVLGIGGVRALEAAGYDPDVWHSNEGHAGFLGLERIRRLVTTENLSFDEAREFVRATTVFTTHTPVAAGIDVYPVELMERYFESFAKEVDISFEKLLEMGGAVRAENETTPESGFNMAVMGLRLASRANAVSKLHGEVSRAMFSHLWQGIPEDEVPITSITNGVHTSTWLGPEMTELLDRRLAPGWAETGNADWARIQEVPDAELWRARERARERLVYFVRERLREQMIAAGVSEADAAWTDEAFDPGILTIGFARRFAQYKRGTLILTDPLRLKVLLLSSDRPIQIVIAGKAHPLDDGGKEMIRQLVHFSSDPDVRGRIAFIQDYDMEVARVLCQGADVWLNNPRRPLEACGTSGMKAALNGALNCSVLDGWWDEAYNGSNGWRIGTRESHPDPDYQDRLDANSLYDLLEREIIPRFYDRSEGPVPRRWIERIKTSIAGLGPFVNADRMVREYVDRLYAPAAGKARDLGARGYTRARELASWRARVREAWSDVQILDVEGDMTEAGVGEERSVMARVRIGRLATDDLAVQLAHGRVGANGELIDPTFTAMSPGESHDGICSFGGSFVARKAGLYGFAVRVVPAHQDLTSEIDLGLVAWA